MRWRSLFSILSLSLFMSTCGGKSGGVAAVIACSLLAATVNGASLTVGLTEALLAGLQSQTLSRDTNALNETIKGALNDALKAASLDSQLSIKTVSSVAKDAAGTDDGVRFLELQGNLAPGVSFASALLSSSPVQEALAKVFSLRSGKAFNFVQDSFRVNKLGSDTVFLEGDPSLKQWMYKQTNLTSAREIAAKLSDQKDQVVVAVIDTGVSLSHPALADNIYKKNGEVVGYDFANNDNDPDDDEGHGTHCAGIIAAKKTSEDGMIGVGELIAPGKVKILPIKVLSKKGGGSTDAINKGIRFAMAQGADVISMSLGGGVDFQDYIQSNSTESQIIRDAVNAGVIVVVAAGNENCPLGGQCNQQTLFVLSQSIKEYTVLPCSYNGTICVGATDPDATLASYSNFPSSTDLKGVDPSVTEAAYQRKSPDISAPGSAIYSTYLNGGYKVLDGTSMATPYVAGLAAIYQLKTSAAKKAADGSAQKTFRRVLQEAELALQTEQSETRSHVGQVDLAYFMAKLLQHNTGEASGPAPSLSSTQESSPDSSEPAPNALSALCSAL